MDARGAGHCKHCGQETVGSTLCMECEESLPPPSPGTASAPASGLIGDANSANEPRRWIAKQRIEEGKLSQPWGVYDTELNLWVWEHRGKSLSGLRKAAERAAADCSGLGYAPGREERPAGPYNGWTDPRQWGCLAVVAIVALLGFVLQMEGAESPAGDHRGASEGWSADQCAFTRGLIEGGNFSGQELENMEKNYNAYC